MGLFLQTILKQIRKVEILLFLSRKKTLVLSTKMIGKDKLEIDDKPCLTVDAMIKLRMARFTSFV